MDVMFLSFNIYVRCWYIISSSKIYLVKLEKKNGQDERWKEKKNTEHKAKKMCSHFPKTGRCVRMNKKRYNQIKKIMRWELRYFFFYPPILRKHVFLCAYSSGSQGFWRFALFFFLLYFKNTIPNILSEKPHTL